MKQTLYPMNYNNIMCDQSQGPPSFLYKQSSQQSSSQFQQIILQKQQGNPLNLPKMQNNHQINHLNAHPQIQKTLNQLQTSIVQVKPVKTSYDDPPIESMENFILASSQNSQPSLSEVNQQKDSQRQTSATKNNIVFQYDQQLDTQMSPQSSIRKLYKEMKSQERQLIRLYQAHQKQPKQQIIVSQSKLFQQIDEEEDLQMQIENITNKKQLKSNNLYDLVSFPVPKSKMIKCLIKVTNNNLFALQNVFDLYLYQQKKHLMRGRKKRFRFSNTFQILGKEKNHIQQIAKVKSNFTRTQYKLIQLERKFQFSEKHSQKKVQSSFNSQIIKITPMFTEDDLITIEKQDCYLAYQPNFLGINQQRLIIIKPRKNISKSDRFSDLKNSYQNCQYERFHKFGTRMAQKRTDGKLILDFKQKNLIDSTKNMIIEDQFGQTGLVFAKTQEDLYILNVMYPFNILQAFFLALCNLDRKPLVL